MILFSLHHCVDGVELYVFTFTINSNLYLQNYVLHTIFYVYYHVLYIGFGVAIIYYKLR